MATKRVSPAVLVPLQEALATAYWFKNDLRAFLRSATGEPELIAQLDWGGSYKRAIVRQLVTTLADNQHRYFDTLVALILATAEIDPSSLKRLDDGAAKYESAIAALRVLQDMVGPYRAMRSEAEAAAQRRRLDQERAEQKQAPPTGSYVKSTSDLVSSEPVREVRSDVAEPTGIRTRDQPSPAPSRTKSSGILPVRYPTPLRASPGISPGSLAPAHPRKGRLDAVGSAADVTRQAGQHSLRTRPTDQTAGIRRESSDDELGARPTPITWELSERTNPTTSPTDRVSSPQGAPTDNQTL